MKFITATAGLLVAALLHDAANATDYRFAVVAPQLRKVVLWSTGDIDPGKEYLRVATGVRYPGASITDYNPATDASLPVEKLASGAAVLSGVPVLGTVLKALGIF